MVQITISCSVYRCGLLHDMGRPQGSLALDPRFASLSGVFIGSLLFQQVQGSIEGGSAVGSTGNGVRLCLSMQHLSTAPIAYRAVGLQRIFTIALLRWSAGTGAFYDNSV